MHYKLQQQEHCHEAKQNIIRRVLFGKPLEGLYQMLGLAEYLRCIGVVGREHDKIVFELTHDTPRAALI